MMSEIKNVYFIGIGGIGMSAIARFYRHNGYCVAGYDRVSTTLTSSLEGEGIGIHYEDNINLINTNFLCKDTTLIIYTPAIPKEHSELNYFINNGYKIVKRSKALGVLSENKKLIAIAGTHGKTSISTMAAWFGSKSLLNSDGTVGGGSAFLGGISKNINSNLLLGSGDVLTVEADEFDRSFLQLYPNIAVVSSVDADHLDIYGDHNTLKNTFSQFLSQVKDNGVIIYKKGLDIDLPRNNITIYTYSLNNEHSDFYAKNIKLGDDYLYSFDIITPKSVIKNCHLGIPALVNVENCIAAVASIWCAGCDEVTIKDAISTFKGVKRRFELYINRADKVYIDDYAHHPRELTATIESVRAIYKGKSITILFQPHLYSRTRDFADQFSKALSLADKVLLLPIYPARELPIEGVTSSILLDNITLSDKRIVEKEEVLDIVKSDKNDIFITFGAGDIDLFPAKIVNVLN